VEVDCQSEVKSSVPVSYQWAVGSESEIHGKRIKINKGVSRQLNIPFFFLNCKRSMEKSQPNGIIHQGVRRTPYMEGHNMVVRIFSRFSVEFWDVGW
jgi:hypothetical protein